MRTQKSLFVLFCLLFCVGAAFFGIHTYGNAGFSIRQITACYPVDWRLSFSWESEEEHAAVCQILEQPFTYLGKGCQCYAFLSQDGNYVLKFFKHKHLRVSSFWGAFPLPSCLKEKWEKHKARRVERAARLFTACEVAYTLLREESGLVWVHLDRRPATGKKICLYDPLGFAHRIEIDQYDCLLQQAALPVHEAFACADAQKISAYVTWLADLILHRCQKGVEDQDRSFVQNVALLPAQQKALCVDVGQLRANSAMQEPEAQKRELQRRLKALEEWTALHFPHHLPIVQREVAKALTAHS